jgi:hypothetical protein
VVTVRGSGDDERTSDHIHTIKVWDKNSALEKLGKHLAMFTDKVDHTSSDGTMSPAQMTEEQVDARLAELEAKRAK